MSLRFCVAFTCILAFGGAELVADAGEGRASGRRQPPGEELEGGRHVRRNERAPESLWRLDPVGWRADGAALESRSSGFALADIAPAGAVELRARVRPRSCGGESFGTVGIAAYVSARDFWCLSLAKGPDHFGAQRFVELGPMTDGQWPAYGLYKRVEDRKGETWEWGRAYDLSLRFAPDRVEGEVRNAETGALVYRTAFEPKGRPLLPSGAIPALRATGNFKAMVESSEMDAAAGVAGPSATGGAATATPPYSPVGPETGVRGAATGFFHVENLGGIDWAVDPVGRAIPITGIDHVKWEGFPCEKLGGRRAYRDHNLKAYPSTQAWADDTLARLRAWGFDMLAAGCDLDTLGHRGMAHAISLAMSDRFTYADEEWWIAENKHAPCNAFPNVFHADYARACEWAAETLCASSRDDPWLVGWFIDNELCWWGRGSDVGAGLFDLVSKLPPGHSARKALEEWLESNQEQTTASAVPREAKIGFLRLVAERYFSINAAAIRAADPNHAVLGCRFARGTLWTHDVVWEEAGKYCDAVSLNFYPWCDLDRGVVLTDQGGIPIQGELRRVHALCRRPLLITEWSFPALDAGRPCLHGAGQRFRTQAERAAAVELYVRTLLAEPFIAGYNWFMWVDQPATGLRPALPEDSNYGLVNEQDEPYALVTEAFARANGDATALKAGDDGIVHKSAIATNVHKSEISIPFFSERERYYSKAPLREGGGGKAAGGSTPGGAAANLDLIVVGNGEQLPFVDNAVGFHQKADGSWSLSNGLVRLSGRIGGAFMADEIAFPNGGASPPGEPQGGANPLGEP